MMRRFLLLILLLILFLVVLLLVLLVPLFAAFLHSYKVLGRRRSRLMLRLMKGVMRKYWRDEMRLFEERGR